MRINPQALGAFIGAVAVVTAANWGIGWGAAILASMLIGFFVGLRRNR